MLNRNTERFALQGYKSYITMLKQGSEILRESGATFCKIAINSGEVFGLSVNSAKIAVPGKPLGDAPKLYLSGVSPLSLAIS